MLRDLLLITTIASFLALQASPACSQEEPAVEAPAVEPEPTGDAGNEESGEADPATQGADETTAGEEQPKAEEPTAEDFQAMLDQWNATLKRLTELRDEYGDADADRRKAIRAEFDKTVTTTEQLLPQLAVAAEKKFAAEPQADGEAALFLIEYVRDQVRRDDFEQAAKLGSLLLDNNVGEAELLEAAGTAAMMIGDLEAAEKRYSEAAAKGKLSFAAADRQKQLPYYKKLWEEELAFRAAEAEADDLPRITMKTNKGAIVFELFENEAPKTVANFVNLVEKKYYDGLTFHRVLPNFMAQGGCPEGTGTGGPGYNIPCECVNEKHRKHFRGTLSMAHAGRDTGGSQFFLNFVPTNHLDGKHTVFGRVIEGMDVLAKLQRRNPGDPAGPAPDKIIKAEVVRKRDHPYEPERLPEK